jgi:Transglutaminase-like superfamily
MRLRCSLQPLGSILRRIERMEKSRRAVTVQVDDLVDAVLWASAWVPKSTCLVQALALFILLKKEGLSGSLFLGVDVGSDEIFRSHAWVAQGERILIGESDYHRYRVIHQLHTR